MAAAPHRTDAGDDPTTAEVAACWQAWDRAVSAALDDAQLAHAARLACTAVPAAARVGPAVRAHLIRWAAHCFNAAGTSDLRAALHAALHDQAPPTPMTLTETTLPRPPDVDAAGPALRERLTGLDPTTDHPPQGGPPWPAFWGAGEHADSNPLSHGG